MTKEEITKEAMKQVDCCTPLYPESFIQGYLAGAEPREKRITELKVMLQKKINTTTVSDYPYSALKLEEAKELLKFWVNDFYDSFNHSNKYEERHKVLVETEQFLNSEVEK